MSNQSTNRGVLISCLVVGVIVCLCASIASIIGAGVLIYNSTTTTSSSASNNNTVETNPIDVELQMDAIESEVSTLRGLDSKRKVSRQLLTPAELRQRVLDDFLNDYTEDEAQQDALALWAFGLLDRDFKLYDFYVELYSEQIAGYYDQETEEMFVVQGMGFGGPERITYAHEFAHALQDQYYDIEDGLGYSEEDCEADSERCAAISALLEGDASLTESLWFSSYATLTDQKEISEFYSNYASPIYDSAPQFMKEDFLFPYQQGQAFVETLYEEGGWAAVDQAYSNPPTTTEQILHPERYLSDPAEVVEIPLTGDELGEGWEEVDRGVMGEWYTSLILYAGLETEWRISQSQASQAAEGWEGDSYAVFRNADQNQVVMVLFSLWDDEGEAAEFAAIFQDYARKRFGSAQTADGTTTTWSDTQGIHAIFQQGAYTAWILSPDEETVDYIWQLLPTE